MPAFSIRCVRICFMLVFFTVGFASLAPAQSLRVRIPASRGATVLSTYIDSQARMLVARGDYAISIARSRKIGAEAAKLELENSIDWIHTYFTRKEVNREYRRKLDPSYMDNVLRRYTVEERRILEQSHDLVKGDVTKHLNWLLDSLATTSIGQALNEKEESFFAKMDEPLSDFDVNQIIVAEGAALQGKKLTFRISKGEVIETRWPFILRGDEFKEQREHFEDVRDSVLKSMKEEGELNWTLANQLKSALDRLSDKYHVYYSGPRYSEGWYRRIADHQDYLIGRRYLETLAAAVGRLLILHDDDAFTLTQVFDGQTVLKLVNVMCLRGLHFSEPEPGGESTYQKLFYAMREVYKNLHSQSMSSTSERNRDGSP